MIGDRCLIVSPCRIIGVAAEHPLVMFDSPMLRFEGDEVYQAVTAPGLDIPNGANVELVMIPNVGGEFDGTLLWRVVDYALLDEPIR